MCTCSNQLQPHDALPRACPAETVIERYGSFDQPNGASMIADLRRLTAEQEDEHPYAAELDLGGEG